MEKTIFFKKLNNLKFISHRLGFSMTNYPENSLEALKEIFKNKKMLNACFGFEFDICFTKDNIPVVIHDKYIDDISDNIGLVNAYNIDELKKIKFNFRKSLINNKNFEFKIATLEEILIFFSSNKQLIKNKIKKIETKDINIFSKKNIRVLANIINKFPNLFDNIVHLSFYPINLINLKKIQKEQQYHVIKSDLLCDYKQIVWLAKFIKSIDSVSLRVKTNNFPKMNINNSKKVNKKIFLDTLFMKFSNAINNKTIKYTIKKYGSVGIYVLNNENDINEFCNKIDNEIFLKYYDKMYFTTDNPLYLKSYKL